MTPEDTVRDYFAAYSDGRPDRFDELVSPDYVDDGHTVPVTDRRAPGTTTNTPSNSQVA
jgi:ketosteroid isomerase-like protein